ncbi:hypothetical protein BJF92_13725 [Rhizobium rhizosphaerae]|uniref:Uncharacterized protein n=1 Tax=Xaviernesmea rhizosphaerae TaxID=1672749 RepID=A0A1Q9AI45_9HYPH|nr:hypothetical protein [Xaviernesmea rhizosphaerae]OLP54864.1 hypothetical protein BJF92_13725 [Xaviernesmea rhizosphaerae]
MFLSRKPNYDKIFSSTSSIFDHLYSDRSKTASILADKDFLDAWLESAHVGQITGVIRGEAVKGDLPSIKQMIWVTDLYFQNADSFSSNPDERKKMKTHFLQERVLFAEKAVSLGLRDRSYQAMVASVNLYRLISSPSSKPTDVDIRTALNGIITNANTYLSLKDDDEGMNEDARNVLEEFGKYVDIINAFNRYS